LKKQNDKSTQGAGQGESGWVAAGGVRWVCLPVWAAGREWRMLPLQSCLILCLFRGGFLILLRRKTIENY